MHQYRRTGDVTYVQLDNEELGWHANVIFIGADYKEFEVKNLYKALNVIKPDVVLLQVRPDEILEGFEPADSVKKISADADG